MPWSTQRSSLHIEKVTVLVRDSDMTIARLSQYPGVTPIAFMSDDREPGAKAVLFRFEHEGSWVEMAQNSFGTLMFAETYSTIVRLGSMIRGRPMSDVILMHAHMSCRYWKKPDLNALTRFISEWEEWRDVPESLEDLGNMQVQCCSFLNSGEQRVCLNFRRLGGEAFTSVDLKADGTCDVVGLVHEEEAEKILELANSVCVHMERV